MSLTDEEIKLINRVNKIKEQAKERQKRFREKQLETNPNYKEERNSYMREYNANLRKKYNQISRKDIQTQEAVLKEVEIPELVPIKVSKRTRRGKKRKPNADDITPAHQKRKEPLELSTIENYISQANIINKLFLNQPLSQKVKSELRKLFDNNAFDENLILEEMPYINKDIIPTLTKLREKYQNDNTYKTYVNIFVVITSHIKPLYDTYQLLTKTNIQANKQIQEKREENILEVKDEGKIISLDPIDISSNLAKIKNINDKLIYGLYTLFPARRLEWRLVKLTNETDVEKLNDNFNYLIIKPNSKVVVFNEYKTKKKYKQQTFNIPKDLDKIFNEYISENQLKINDYLFPLGRDKREIIRQSNFSSKVSNVFKKIYNRAITIRHLRMSWASNLHKQNPSVRQINELATTMAHSPEENLKYKKL